MRWSVDLARKGPLLAVEKLRKLRRACFHTDIAVRESIQQVRKTGAGEGIRTLDPNLGKVVLYP